MVPIMSYGQRQQAMQGLPFYGRSEFNFAAAKSPYSSGISIKLLPLSDLSRVAPVNIDSFANGVSQMNQKFKRGSRISGIQVNSHVGDRRNNPKVIIGKFETLKIDRETQSIRAFIRDPKTLKLIEVYPETLTRLNESKSEGRAKTFLEYLI